MAELNELTCKRGQIKGQITRFTKFVEEFDVTKKTVVELQTRLDKIEPLWQQFDDFHLEITLLDEDPSHEEYRGEFEDSYFDVVAKAKALIATHVPAQSGTIGTSTVTLAHSAQASGAPMQNIKLPVIPVPKFHGDYRDWPGFFDTFTALVDKNASLSCAQKFYYLKEALRDGAKQVIESLEVSEHNYKVALELLKGRFDNKRLIKRAHIASLFNIPALAKESYQSLRRFLDEINKHVRALKNLGEAVDTWDSILLYLISTKLDPITKRDWEQCSAKLKNEPNMADLESFLTERCNILENIDSNVNRGQSKPTARGADTRSFALTNSNRNTECAFCKGSHYIFSCFKFLKLSVPSRLLELKKLKLCTNCLRPGHQATECRSGGCRRCNGRHNSIIHTDDEKSANRGIEKAQTENVSLSGNESHSKNQNGISSLATHNTSIKHSQVLLSTAVVNISNNKGKPVTCRALLDSGSQSNFLSRRMYTKLGLNGRKIDLPVTGIGQVQTKINLILNAIIAAMQNNYRKELSFLVIDKITDEMPASDFDITDLNIPDSINLADPSFNSSGSIDMLLGAGIFWDIILNGQINLGVNQPRLQNSKLGWIVAGVLNANSISMVTKIHCNVVNENSLQEQVERFWAIEECHSERRFTEEEELCEKIFVNTTTRDPTGRFIVNLPLRKPASELGDSENKALTRFLSLERKLNCNIKLKKEYTEFINEYCRLGHMTKIDGKLSNESAKFYLPHHCIVKESSTTTKLRVVFDASAKTTSNVSLNDILMIGPVIQDDLFSILLRFRKYNFVIIADIEKMYRQILVNEDQRDLQRILWRENSNEPVSHYRLNTVTYGTASASFLAIRTLHQLAHENSEAYPEASRIILEDFYVDDLITGTNTLEEMLRIKREISHILEGGKFVLRKWMSNSREELLASEQSPENTNHYIISDGTCIKTLGLLWNANSDTIQVTTFTEPLPESLTKRKILSTISQVFDPLGLIGPITIRAKILLQKLWLLKIGWDEPVPAETYTTWQQFCEQIHSLKRLEIPRLILAPNHDTQCIQLHGFSDASEVAYGASIYVRSCDPQGNVTVSLVCAKSKVAPVKSLTLPRLELSGALLLAQLMRAVMESLKLNFSEVYYWCDSTITLAWIAAPSTNWKTFVCNRVSKIQQLTSKHQWRYVKSEDNPADIISRGTTTEKLISSILWWSGPAWLKQGSDQWPNNIAKPKEIIPEFKPISLVQTETANHEIFCKYSSLTRLQRIVAYLFRFVDKCKHKAMPEKISVSELHHSMNVLIKVAQAETFPEELKRLMSSKQILKSSKLSSLNPFMDENGLIRVGGRLSNANITMDQRHPIILSGKHPLTRLIVFNEHIKNLHAGPQATLSFVRHTFWPLKGKSTIKSILYSCVKCFRARPTHIFPQMANLPIERVQAVRPFFNAGVDFAGPFCIKDGITRNRKLVKCYLCIFICLATRAVHLELCGNMSSECFLNALKRFISRRGICNTLISDNGTNFRGANNEMKEVYDSVIRNFKEAKVDHYLTQNFITWKFIPANSPHFGGSWEAAVKLAKYHLKRIVGNAHLTFEELNTVLVQVEAILNSRPLIPISDSPNDPIALTPSHFLIGDILNAIPQLDVTQIQPGRLSHYKRLQQIIQHFWKRWSSEYLSTLQARTKWRFTSPTRVKIGAVVVLKIDNLPPLSWPMGRIVQLHPSDDGNVRVVSVRTANGIVRRAVTKICLIPLDDQDSLRK